MALRDRGNGNGNGNGNGKTGGPLRRRATSECGGNPQDSPHIRYRSVTTISTRRFLERALSSVPGT